MMGLLNNYNFKGLEVPLYWRIERLEHYSNNYLKIVADGYTSRDNKELGSVTEFSSVFEMNKNEIISYEIAYSLLKTLPDFENATDVIEEPVTVIE